MTILKRVLSGDTLVQDSLSLLLIDSVNGGASVGFISPLRYETAAAYWESVFSSLGSGLALWTAEDEGRIVGSVQLALCQKANGLHRAEVQKLFVHSAFRGRGIASRLMAAVESFALSEGRSLLVLDTEAGSPAEVVYQHLGWTRLGEIPNYARTPDGTLHATAYYFKTL
jgi:acetyltransferase